MHSERRWNAYSTNYIQRIRHSPKNGADLWGPNPRGLQTNLYEKPPEHSTYVRRNQRGKTHEHNYRGYHDDISYGL